MWEFQLCPKGTKAQNLFWVVGCKQNAQVGQVRNGCIVFDIKGLPGNVCECDFMLYCPSIYSVPREKGTFPSPQLCQCSGGSEAPAGSSVVSPFPSAIKNLQDKPSLMSPENPPDVPGIARTGGEELQAEKGFTQLGTKRRAEQINWTNCGFGWCHHPKLGVQKMQGFGIWGCGLMGGLAVVGLDDLKSFFHPKWFCDH